MRAFLLILAAAVARAAGTGYLDLAPFARTDVTAQGVTLEWDEERDVREIAVTYREIAPRGAKVEYWFHTWPYPPPQMPTLEDPVDDPWQGRWLSASVEEACEGSECRYLAGPLAAAENPRAANLPGARYRRTLKIRVTAATPIAAVRVFSDSAEVPLSLDVRLGGKATFEVYNGSLVRAEPAGNGYRLELVASAPAPPGSNDVTVVTVHGERRTVSFSAEDLKQGPIRLPDFDAVIADPRYPMRTTAGPRIRQRIPAEPEQTYERASREIPPLDAWNRQNGDRVYLPLAADSSWQKFAFEYGGAVFISKRGTKAKGRELARLQWEGDRATWRLGAGGEFDRRTKVSVLDNCLPVVTQRWQAEGLDYSEEAFAALARGPLAPSEARSEQTPAVLLIRVTAANRGAAPRRAHLAQDGQLRALAEGPLEFDVPPGGSRSVVFKLPFVSDLSDEDRRDIERLDWVRERERVIAYWNQSAGRAARFRVPEARFNDFLKAVAVHIRISATRDPKSGLFMAPAASYNYQVYANESCFQALLLDTLGDFDTARDYLETFLRLQGSRSFPGLHHGREDAIFHGARVDDVYDYTASNYGLDHGVVLWTLGEHYLYSRDRAWLERAWPHMRKAIDWIVEQRGASKAKDAQGRPARDYGLLPASHLEDNSDWGQWFTINAFAWAGLDRTAQALADIGHPEAARVRREADAYRADLRAAVLRAAETAPVRRMRDGTFAPYVPVKPQQRFGLFSPLRVAYYSRYGKGGGLPIFRLSATREVLYGPMMLLTLGVFDCDEPIARWILDDWEDNLTLTSGLGLNVHGLTDDRLWFSQGGMVFQANLQNPILVYLRRHEIEAAVRSLYNNFVACLYPDANAFTEEYRMWERASGPFYKIPDEARFVNRLRDVLVLEQGDTLWLAPGTPRRWLESAEGIRVDGVMSWFGPVKYSMHASGPGRIEAEVELPRRNPPRQAWLVVRTPSRQMREVRIGGRPWTRIDRTREAIELPRVGGRIQVEVRY